MDATVITLLVLLLITGGIGVWKQGWRFPILGLMRAKQLVEPMWLRLLLGITLGGLTQVLVPPALVTNWMGPDSGLGGILVGSYVGLIMVGGPYVQLPILASIYKAGAAPGPIIALLVAGNLLSLQILLSWHLPFFGARISLARFTVCLVVPPLVGLAGAALLKALGV